MRLHLLLEVHRLLLYHHWALYDTTAVRLPHRRQVALAAPTFVEGLLTPKEQLSTSSTLNKLAFLVSKWRGTDSQASTHLLALSSGVTADALQPLGQPHERKRARRFVLPSLPA